MDPRKIIYGVLKFMFHSSCSRERVGGGERNVVHDGKTKAKEQKKRVRRRN